MEPFANAASKLTPKTFVDSMIRVGLVAILGYLCLRVFSPFVALMVWGLILAVVLYPLHQQLARRIGNKQGLASTLIVVVGILLMGGPLIMLGLSFTEHIQGVRSAIESNEFAIPQPGSSVAEWPLIGEKTYAAWSQAASNLPQFAEDHADQLKEMGQGIASAAGSAIGSTFLFLASLIVAGIMMAYGQSGSAAMMRILTRVAGPRGPHLHRLTTATIRSVAVGVLGVAFIQALLFGIGFLLANIPAAGALALVVLFMGILQLPAIVIALPVIVYLWASGDASTAANIGFTIYFIVAGLADNVLKPMLLGRGVDAPMPVILIGALGGMVVSGFIGLFLGAILLAVGYQIFMEWVKEAEVLYPDPNEQTPPARAEGGLSETTA